MIEYVTEPLVRKAQILRSFRNSTATLFQGFRNQLALEFPHSFRKRFLFRGRPNLVRASNEYLVRWTVLYSRLYDLCAHSSIVAVPSSHDFYQGLITLDGGLLNVTT